MNETASQQSQAVYNDLATAFGAHGTRTYDEKLGIRDKYLRG
ncbi:MAG: hypothetical protein QF573_08440 [Chloroflexota bacterium]|nr:hypothetical protein [Chloroflexota bacterium]